MDTIFKNHTMNFLFKLLSLTMLFMSITIEAHIFIHKKNVAYYLMPISCILLLPLLQYLTIRARDVCLVDFACLKPSPRLRVPAAFFLEHLSLINCFPKESISFMSKIMNSSGLSEETYFPPPLHCIPPSTHHRHSISEAHMLLFPVFDDLLSKTDLSPSDIDILIINCSGFCPSPSLSSIMVNHYFMRDDMKTFNISGMGCSAGAICIDIAKNLLKMHPNSCAVIISTEILSTGWYAGKDPNKLLLNCFFRMGSSAVLLTNRRKYKKRSKYKLVHIHRTQRAFDDRAYRSAIREEDDEGVTGFSIEQHDLLCVAAEILRSNLVSLGNVILPLHEKLRYAIASSSVPDFRSTIQYYCMPGSGRGVIEEIGKGLKLRKRDMEAALATFHRFGNQSSASIWYQLAYIEATRGRMMKKGERLLQLGMGSGPKCNSLVWECSRKLSAGEVEKGPWFDRLRRYSVAY